MSRSTAPAGADEQRLSAPALRSLVERHVRARLPAADVEDVVQTVLCAAVAAKRVPDDDEHLRRWLIGIARHKIADLRRQRGRAKEVELGAHHRADPPAIEARELARWAEQQLPDTPEAQRTLEWMAREGDGEKLAHIAATDRVPADRVRQRVSRMRRFMKQRWSAELAAVAALLGAVIAVWWLLQPSQPMVAPIAPDPPLADAAPEEMVDPRLERAVWLRNQALRECERTRWQPCLDDLDEAAKLDPAGDSAPFVEEARRRAARALAQPPSEPSNLPEAPPPAPAPLRPKPGPPTPTAPSSSATPPPSWSGSDSTGSPPRGTPPTDPPPSPAASPTYRGSIGH